MKAVLINHRRFVIFSRFGRPVVVEMNLYRIHGKEAAYHPEGYRLGWIAFDPENPSVRVLFDSHPPKGVHFHVDAEEVGNSFSWKSLSHAEQTFFDMVCRHFNVAEEDLR